MEISIWVIYSTLLGAMAGYITNYYAIEHLFKDFGPFKSVIGKSQNKLAKELSEMVEDKIINQDNLINSIGEEKLKEDLELILKDILEINLPNLTKDKLWKDIEGFKETSQNIELALKRALENNQESITDLLDSNFLIGNLVKDSQQDKLLDTILNILLVNLENDNKFNLYLIEIIKENPKLSLIDVLGKETIDIILGDTQLKLNSLLEEIFEKDEVILSFLNSLMEKYSLFNLFYLTLKQLSNQSFSSILKDENIKILLEDLLDSTTKVLDTPKSRNELSLLLNRLLDSLSDSNLSLYEIMPSIFNIELEEFLETKLEAILPQIIDFIQSKSKDVAILLEKSTRKMIQEGTSAKVANNLRKLLEDKIIQEVANEEKISQAISDFIQKNLTNPQIISEKIVIEVVKFLRSKTIRDVTKLIKSNYLAEDGKVIDLLLNFFIKNKTFIISSGNEFLKTKNISLVLSDKRISKIAKLGEDIALKRIIYNLKDNRNLILEKINLSLAKEYENFTKLTLSQVITPKNLSRIEDKANKKVVNFIKKYQISIKDYFKKLIFSKPIVNKLLLSKIRDRIPNLFLAYLNKLANSKMNGSLERIANNSELRTKLIRSLQDRFISSNLSKLIQAGEMTRQNIENLNKKQLCQSMQGFMGRNMKPLCFLGAIFGSIGGLVSSFILTPQPFNSVFSLTGLYLVLILGGIGVITNWLAVKGLFRPYQKTRILKLQGIIPHNQEKAATSLAKFVETELMNQDKIKTSFSQKQESCQDYIFNMISKDNYQTINNLFVNNKANLAKLIVLKLDNYLENNKDLNFILRDILTNFKISDLITKDNIKSLSFSLIPLLQSNSSDLAEILVNLFKNTSLNTFWKGLSLSQQSKLTNFLQGNLNNKLGEYLDSTKITSLLEENQDNYLNFKARAIAEIFPSEFISNSIKEIELNLIRYLFSDNSLELLINKINTLLTHKMDSTKSIAELFEGKIVNFVDGHRDDFLDYFITKIISNGINRYKQPITQKIKEQVHEGAGVLEKLAFAFIDVDNLIEHILDDTFLEIPNLLTKNKLELNILLTKVLDKEVYPLRLHQLKFLKDIQAKKIISILLKEDNKSYFEEYLRYVLKETSLVINKQPVGNYLDNLGFKELVDFYFVFEKEANLTFNNINEFFENPQFYNDLVRRFNKLLFKLTSRLSLKEALPNLGKDKLEKSINGILSILSNGNQSGELIYHFLEDIYNFISYSNFSDYLDVEDLSNSLILNCKLFIEKQENKRELEAILQNMGEVLSTNPVNILNSETREFILKIIIKASLDSLNDNLPNLLDDFNFKEITYKAVMELEGRELEKLFYSFAQNYFNRLINFGAMGGLFGFHYFISLLILISHIIYTHQTKSPN